MSLKYINFFDANAMGPIYFHFIQHEGNNGFLDDNFLFKWSGDERTGRGMLNVEHVE